MGKETQDSPDLSKVNSALATKILGSVVSVRSATRSSSQFALTKTGTTLTKYERVGQKLNKYKEAVESKLIDLRNKAIINLIFIAATVVFLVVALAYANLGGIVGSVGLGATSLFAQATTWKDTLIAFINDGGKLRRRVNYIEGQYRNCDSNNDAEVQKIDDLIENDFLDLDKAQLP